MPGLSHATAWFISLALIEAAVIDGWKLKVPNWLTYNLALGGLAFAGWSWGGHGLLWSAQGLVVGLALLLPLYAIGGMGAGDVKLLAGVGAWMGPALTLNSFVASAITGAVMALVMIAWSGHFARHWSMFQTIGFEIMSIRSPTVLSGIAAQRKASMLLLPYGIPIAAGTIGYLAWTGILF